MRIPSIFANFTKIWAIALPLFFMGCQQQSEKKSQMLCLNFQEGDVPSLHPHPTIGGHIRARVLGKMLFEGLTRINSREEAELAGAESVDISPCQTQYTFTLRENHWSDGTPVTAFHYEKAWKGAMAPASDCTRADLFYVIAGAKEAKEGSVPLDAIGIKALDEKTLFVELTFPIPYFLELIASPLFAPIVREATEPTRFNGPFMVEKWKREDFLLLKANPHFWDHKQISIKQIEIQMVTDPSTALSMYEKKKLDWIGDPISPFSPEMVASLQKRGELKQRLITRALWIYFNAQHPSLSSAHIRKALSLAIDRSLIAEHIFIGNLPLYQPLPIPISLCPNSLSDNDPLQAKQLFKQGLRDYNLTTLPPLTLSYPNNPGRKPLAEYLKEVWEKTFDIKVHLQAMEWNAFCSNLEEGNYQMGVSGASALYPDPTDFLDRFEYSEESFSHWEHPLYQEKLMLAREAVEPEQRSRLLGEAEAILVEESPLMPLCNFVALYTHHPKLKGYVFDHAGYVDFRWAYFE